MAWGDVAGPGSEPRRTALATWRTRSGRSGAWLSRESGVPLRTVMRALAGQPIRGAAARAVSRVTGVRLEELV